MSGSNEPLADRPVMPGYGIAETDDGLLAWAWAEERLVAARSYWVTTTNPDGTPHAMPVWGVWVDGALWFSTGGRTRKAANLAARPACTVHPGDADEAVVVEGRAERVTDADRLAPVLERYAAKYEMAPPELDEDGDENPMFRVKPRRAFGLVDDAERFSTAATRWTF